jgi:TIR domain
MSRIFISHSSLDNERAFEVLDWLVTNGWDDVFLDLDPVRGLAPGERWQNALKVAADRCEAVLFLISPNWLDSRWCRSELLLAKLLGKRLFPVIIGDVAVSALPAEFAADHQVVDVVLDPQGWKRLKQGLKRASMLTASASRQAEDPIRVSSL